MLFITNESGCLLSLAGRLERFLGPGARAGAKLADLVPPDDHAAATAAWAKLAAAEDDVVFDLRLRAADGAYRPVSVSARRSKASGEIHGEIRERDPQEEVLRRDARFHRTLIDTLPVVFVNTDPQGNYLYFEGKGLEQAGLRPGQLVGQSFFDVFAGHPGVPTARRAMAGEEAHSIEDAQGIQGIPIENWWVPLRDSRGEIESVVGISMDLTEAKRAEVELREKLTLIKRQQQVIRELATPIIEVWDKVLTLPMLGVVDSMRTAEVMERLLNMVSQNGARFAILDLTGVDAVDTSTARHLLKLVQALKLLGAEGIITGIQPSVAQTMVALGVDMESITTLAKLRDGLRLCMKRLHEENVT